MKWLSQEYIHNKISSQVISSGLHRKRQYKFSVKGQKDTAQPTIFLLQVIPTISANISRKKV